MATHCYKPLAFFHSSFSGLRAGNGTRRTAETAADAHGDAAAVDEVAREISDNEKHSYDDDDQHDAGRSSKRQVPELVRF